MAALRTAKLKQDLHVKDFLLFVKNALMARKKEQKIVMMLIL